MEDDYEDNTAVIRMKRDFNSFLSDESSRPIFPRCKLSTSGNDSFRNTTSVLSMKTLLDKDREMKLKSAEIVEAKGQISRLETIISHAGVSNKRARLDLEREVEILREEKKVQAEKVSDMKIKLQFVSDKELVAKEELCQGLDELKHYKAARADKVLCLEKDKLKMEEELQQCQEKVSELEMELQELHSNLDGCYGELEDIRNQLHHQTDLNEQQNEEKKALEQYRQQCTRAELSIRDLENQLVKHEDEISVTKAYKLQLDNLPELEKELQTLREENELLRSNEVNVMRLEEETEGLQKKLMRSEERMKELTKLDIENDELRNRLKRWESCKIPGNRQPQSPADLLKHISELQALHIGQLQKQGDLNTSVRRSTEHMKEYKEKYMKTQEKLDSTTSDCHKQADLIKRLQRKLLLISKEREGYKKILESYESEVTINVADPNVGRLQQLEEMVNTYKRQTDILETEHNQQLEHISDLKNNILLLQYRGNQSMLPDGEQDSLKADVEKITELKENIISLESQLKKSEDEKFILEARLEQRHLQGEYDPTKTKILHFTMNPAANAQKKREEDLDVLRSENEKLRRRLEILENAHGQVEDLTQQVEAKLLQPSPNKQIEEMKAQVKSEELRNKRLMEAFKKTSQEFREVCCQITGFKIDITGTNQYRLTSIYAESVKDYLLFQQTSDGNIQMLETDFSEGLQELIDLYLVKQDSVPAFLSSVSLNLFGRQTMNLG